MTLQEILETLAEEKNGIENLVEHPYSLQEQLHACFSEDIAIRKNNIAAMQAEIIHVSWRRGQIIHIEKAQAIDLMQIALASDIPAVWQEVISGLYTLDESAPRKWHDQHRSTISQEKSEWIDDALTS